MLSSLIISLPLITWTGEARSGDARQGRASLGKVVFGLERSGAVRRVENGYGETGRVLVRLGAYKNTIKIKLDKIGSLCHTQGGKFFPPTDTEAFNVKARSEAMQGLRIRFQSTGCTAQRWVHKHLRVLRWRGCYESYWSSRSRGKE